MQLLVFWTDESQVKALNLCWVITYEKSELTSTQKGSTHFATL